MAFDVPFIWPNGNPTGGGSVARLPLGTLAITALPTAVVATVGISMIGWREVQVQRPPDYTQAVPLNDGMRRR